MGIPYTFATQSGNVPASELDANFTYVAAQAFLNVKNYGAVGDCTFAGVGTDDTAAIQAAITAAAALTFGGTVYFPAAIYKTTSAINVPDKVNLVGQKTGWTNNAGNAWLSGSAIYKAHTGNGITVTSSNTGTRIADLSILSNNVTYAAGNGFVLGPCSACRLERCQVFKVGGDSFVIGDNTSNSYLNSVYDCYGNNPLGRNFVIASKWFVGRSLVSDGGTYGMDVSSAGQSGSTMDNHHEGMSVAGVRFNGGGIFEMLGHNTLVMSGAGIIGVDIANVAGSQLITLAGFQMTGFANASGSRGVRLGGSSNLTIIFTDSDVEAAERGVEVPAGANNFICDKNNFYSCNKAFKVGADYFRFCQNVVSSTVDSQVGDFTLATGTKGQYNGNTLDKVLAASGSGLSSTGQLNGDDTNTAIDNKGWLTVARGTTTLATAGTVAHGLPVAPADWFVTPHATYTGQFYATADATNITVNFGGGGSISTSWEARLQCARQA